MIDSRHRLFAGGLAAVLLLYGCGEGTTQRSVPNPPLVCGLKGIFIVGAPTLIEGSCAGYIPTDREVRVIELNDPTIYDVAYAGGRMRAFTDPNCRLAVGIAEVTLEGRAAFVSAIVDVRGDRLEATVDLRIEGLPVGDTCDVRYGLIGLRFDEERTGNETGGNCGTGAYCVGSLCAFGDISRCAFDVCLYQRIGAVEDVYCTEPCEIGSCPDGFECRSVGDWAYNTELEWFCTRTLPECGDGIVDDIEECDDGNTDDGDGCSAVCDSNEQCGNDVVDQLIGEQCDDGNTIAGDGCSTVCAFEMCGNGVDDPGETCDDGNTLSGDGCSAQCWLEGCGNGNLDVGEGCDDGNLVDTDGCDGQCHVRPVAGTARVDAGWARILAGGSQARVNSHFAAASGTSTDAFVVFAWTESYSPSGPFGAILETFVSTLATASDVVSSPARILGASGMTVEGLVTVDSGEILMLLRSGTTLALARSTDGGQTFSEPAPLVVPQMPLHTEANAFARLYTDGATLYLSLGLHVLIVGENRNLYVSRSTDTGATWSMPRRMSPAADFRGWATPPLAYASGAGDVTLVWGDDERNAGTVYAARSRDSGVTWIRLNEPMGAHAPGRFDVTQAAVVPGDGAVLMAFVGADGVRVARWDGGATPWNVAIVSAGSAIDVDTSGPVAIVAGLNYDVHLAFAIGGRVYVARSLDGGMSFAAPRRVGTMPASLVATAVGSMSIDIDRLSGAGGGDDVILTWLARVDFDGSTGWVPMAIRSPDGGGRWSDEAVALPIFDAALGANAGVWERVRSNTRELAWVTTGEALWLFDLEDIPARPPAVTPAGSAGSGCAEVLSNGGWCSPSTVAAPSARSRSTAVTAGSEVVIFGGSTDLEPRSDGAAYNFTTDSWRHIDAGVAPVSLWGRSDHTAVWTGTEMIVFGGQNGMKPLGDGARYDTASDTWTALPSAVAPSPRTGHTAVWTGTQMIIFGGEDDDGPLDDGKRYDAATDTWMPMRSGPFAVTRHSAIFSNDEMIVFGGLDAGGGPVGLGFRYNPVTDILLPLPTPMAPSPRSDHSAVWTGGKMLVWAGADENGPVSGGASYEPVADEWTILSTTDAPSPRSGQVAVTTASGWLVWGGAGDQSGSLFEFGNDGWKTLSLAGAPTARADAAAAWTGDRVFLFGGVDVNGKALGDGGIFVP